MRISKVNCLKASLFGALFSVPLLSNAGAESGFYLGGGIGSASVIEAGFDEDDSAYKVFGGYNFGVIPLVDLAIEASYVDFGAPDSSVGKVDISGINAFGLAGLSFGPFGIFAKVGMVDWDLESTIPAISNDSGTDPVYGLGLRLALGSFALRAEYEVYDLDVDLEMISVSGVYTF